MRHILRTLLFILFLSFSALPLLAQRLEMDGHLDSESVSPRERDGRLSARVIIQSELRLSYKSNMGDLTPEDILRGENNGMYVDTLYFYITPGENKRRLTLSAVGYPAEVLPFTFKAKETYNYFVFDPLTRANVAPDLGSQYLVLNITPAEAEVTIDGGVPQVVTDGTKNFFLPYGTHTYSVRSRLYKEASGVVTIGSESRTELTVNLEPNFGYINVVSSPSGADVEINNVFVGKTPYKSNKMPLGEHTVRISMADYWPIEERVVLAEGGRSVNLSKELSIKLSTIMCADADAMIYIYGEYKGKGRWSGELLPGYYELKVSKSGHKQFVQTLDVEYNKQILVKIDKLTPIYSKLNISSEQGGVSVFLDDKLLGQAPNVFSNVLVGAHTLKFSKLGFVSAEMNVELLEGEILSVKAPTLRASSSASTTAKATTATKTKTSASTTTQTESMLPDKVLSDLNSNSILDKVFDKEAYEAMGSPKRLVIPEGYTSINVRKVDIKPISTSSPHGVVNSRVVVSSFNDLTSVVIPSTVKKIDKYSFFNCTELKTVRMSNSVTSIEEGAFANCHSLESISLSTSLMFIGVAAFEQCYNLKSLTIPNSVSKIEMHAFNLCTQLASITLPSRLIVITKSMLAGCLKLERINIPTTVKSIDRWAFYRCLALSSVTIPNSVTTIGEQTFTGCAVLSSITLPNSVTSVGANVFSRLKGDVERTIYMSKSSPVYEELKKTYKVKAL